MRSGFSVNFLLLSKLQPPKFKPLYSSEASELYQRQVVDHVLGGAGDVAGEFDGSF